MKQTLFLLAAAALLAAACDGKPDVKRFKREEYNPETKPVVVFNDKTTTVHAGDAFFDEMAAYKPQRWIYR